MGYWLILLGGSLRTDRADHSLSALHLLTFFFIKIVIITFKCRDITFTEKCQQTAAYSLVSAVIFVLNIYKH